MHVPQRPKWNGACMHMRVPSQPPTEGNNITWNVHFNARNKPQDAKHNETTVIQCDSSLPWNVHSSAQRNPWDTKDYGDRILRDFKTDSSASQRLIMIHYGHLLQSDFLMEWQVPTITLDNHWKYKYQNATVTAGSQGHKPIRKRDPNEPKTKCKKIRRDAHARSCMLLDGLLATIITVPQSPRIKSNGKNCYICKAHSKFIRN